MKKELEQTLKESIAQLKLIRVEEIKLDSSLEDMGITSLDSISLIFDIEDKYGIEVPNDELKKVKTLQDIIDGAHALIESNA